MGNPGREKMVLLAICLICCAFYAAEVTAVDQKLRTVDPMTLTFWSGVGITAVAAIVLLIRSGPQGFCIGNANPWWLVIVVLLFFCADYTHFLALNKGAGGVLLSTTYLLIPVLCSLLVLKAPSLKMMLVWALGFLALVLLYSDKPR